MMAEPVVYKYCHECVITNGEATLFPSRLRTWNCHCPKHQKGLVRDMATIRANRGIPIDWFDVFDAEGHHVCRACGSPLLTKEGKRCGPMRWCRRDDPEHNAWRNETIKFWNVARHDHIHDVAAKQYTTIKDKHSDLVANGTLVPDLFNEQQIWIHPQSNTVVVACESCGKLASVETKHGRRLPPAHVHHKRPVHTLQLTEADIMLIFDPGNFIVLCDTCHGKAHRKNPSIELTLPSRDVKTLDSFCKNESPS